MRPRIAILVILVLIAFTGVTPARADENGPPALWTSPTEPAPAEPREKIFYGWQLIPVDMASVALMTLGSGNARKAGIAAYLTSGLLFHALRGNGVQGVVSTGMRAGLPVMGWLSGGILGALGPEPPCSDVESGCGNDWIPWSDFFDDRTAITGLLAGVGCALVFDWVALSWAERTDSTERSILIPQVIAGEQGLSLGVLGRF